MPEYCVTGGTGFIGGFLVKALLEKGHAVRTTVRDPEDADKVSFLWNLEGAQERLKIMKADLLDEGSFNQALEGVDGVFHTASPVPLTPADDNDVQTKLIDPAVKGTRNVLASCIKSESIKRVVITSSVSAIVHPNPDNYQPAADSFNESHWTDIEYCKQQKLWYPYSKTVAEQEAWKISKQNDLDLVVVNPSLVIGPLLAPQPTSTLLYTLSIIKGTRADYTNRALGFVHVDDVVSAHILAMEERKAAGRLICSSSVAHWSEVIDMLRAKYPMYMYESKCSNQQTDLNPLMSLDTRKIIQLGYPGFKSITEMFEDFIQSFRRKGFL